MRYKRPGMFFILITAILFASCSPGHSGGNEIAFIRNGQLWTIDPDGANAFQVVSENTPVIGYSWSPNHHILVYRTLDAQFAKTIAAKQLTVHEVTGQIADAPGTINTIGIDGGTPIPVMLSSSGIQYSNPYWNTGGTRLLYRQESTSAPFVPGSALWWISQNDQPEGIAAKHFPLSYSLPSFSYVDSMAIGNSENGLFSSTLQGTDVHYLVSGQLPGHPMIATLERVLWQPTHAHPLVLYALPSGTSAKSPHNQVQLVTLSQSGQQSVLASCTCTQFAWSPDGSFVLYSTGTSYTILNINTHRAFSIAAEQNSVPYWSPDSQFLIINGPHQLQLVSMATKKAQILLTDGTTPSYRPSDTPVVTIHSLVQPVPNSIWASDSLHFLFLTRGRLQWEQKTLSSGLYMVTINSNGLPQGTPTIVDTGNDTQIGWSYQDMNTSFLY